MGTLDQLDRDGSGFRLRGQEVTRLETFVDAAFAFSLTLLVIFTSDLPQSAAELREALRKVPTFAACFAMLMMFWAAHNRWGRRTGLEDARATLLSLAFVLVVMVYVYPLRMVVSSFLSLLTAGWLPGELRLAPGSLMRDLQTTFLVYSLGFGLLAWLLWRMNAYALRRAPTLELDANERHLLRTESGSHAILATVAGTSVAVSLLMYAFGPEPQGDWRAVAGAPMWVYATLGLWMPWYHAVRERGRRMLAGGIA